MAAPQAIPTNRMMRVGGGPADQGLPPLSMVQLDEPPPTRPVEISRTEVSQEHITAFLAQVAGNQPINTTSGKRAPLSFALALRAGHEPEIRLDAKAFAIHGGHDLQLHQPIIAGKLYIVTGNVEKIYEKTGRSGPLTVIERIVSIRDDSGALATEIRDQQIVRWRPARGVASSSQHKQWNPSILQKRPRRQSAATPIAVTPRNRDRQ